MILRALAVVHVGGRREGADLESERRDAGVGQPCVVDPRRAFGASAAELAVEDAFEADPRAAEVGAVRQFGGGVGLAADADRAGAERCGAWSNRPA